MTPDDLPGGTDAGSGGPDDILADVVASVSSFPVFAWKKEGLSREPGWNALIPRDSAESPLQVGQDPRYRFVAASHFPGLVLVAFEWREPSGEEDGWRKYLLAIPLADDEAVPGYRCEQALRSVVEREHLASTALCRLGDWSLVTP